MRYAALAFLLLAYLPQLGIASQTEKTPRPPAPVAATPPGEQAVRIVSAPTVLTESTKDRYDKTLVLATCALVLVGIFQILYLWRTVQATRDNAKAALLNAQAVIYAERPWLLIPMGNEFSDIDQPIVFTRLPGEYRKSHCTFRLKNYGRSPARVTEQKLRLVIGGNEDDIPTVDPYQPHDAVSEDYTFAQDVTTPLQATIYPDGFVTIQEYEDIFVRKTRSLWLCGYCKYMDTFARENSPVYETRFCYRWVCDVVNVLDHDKHSSFWIMAGPREYNRAT